MDGMIKSCHDENGWVEGTGEGLRRAGMRQGVGVASTGVQRSSAKSATHSVLPSLDHGSHSLASPHGLHVEYGGGPLVRGGMRGHGMDGMIKSCHDEDGRPDGLKRLPVISPCQEKMSPVPLAMLRGAFGFKWSGRPDSNRRPLDPQSSALPGCATARRQGSLYPLPLPGARLALHSNPQSAVFAQACGWR